MSQRSWPLPLGIISAMFIACSGAGNNKPQVAKLAEHSASVHVVPEQTSSSPRDTQAVERLTPTSPVIVNEAKRRAEAWQYEREARANELTARIDELKLKIPEREATYKRRVAAGAFDGATRDEIAKLKKEQEQAEKDLAATEKELDRGPPDFTVAAFEDLTRPTSEAASEVVASTSGGQQRASTQPGYIRSSAATYTPPVTRGPGTVKVHGYYRKDGTYVRPHTRSAPRR